MLDYISRLKKIGTFDEAVTVFTGEDDNYEINDFIFSVETHVEQLRQNGNLNNDEQIAYAAVYKLKEKCGKSIKFNNEFTLFLRS